jgi:hypothetical protein
MKISIADFSRMSMLWRPLDPSVESSCRVSESNLALHWFPKNVARLVEVDPAIGPRRVGGLPPSKIRACGGLFLWTGAVAARIGWIEVGHFKHSHRRGIARY